MGEQGCVVCGKPRSPKDGVEDRCGHHRRQLLRNQAKERSQPAPQPEQPKALALEDLAPSSIRSDHNAGRHRDHPVTACILCIRERGGRISNVETIR